MARDLRLFYVFRLLATSYLWVPIFFFFMESRGLGFDDVMILGSIYAGTIILVEVPTGALADRIGRRHSMMAGSLAMVASCLVAYQAYTFAEFAVSQVLAAVSLALVSGADSAYLFDMLNDNGRGAEYARHESSSSAWHQAGNAALYTVGGLLATYNLAWPYLGTAIVSGAAFFVAFTMRGDRATVTQRDAQPMRAELAAYVRHMVASLGDVRRGRSLAWVMAYSAVAFVLVKAMMYVYQPYLKGRGFGIAETALIYAGVHLVAAFVARRVPNLRQAFGDHSLVWGLLGGLALSFLLLNQVRSEWVMLLLLIQAVSLGLYSPLVKPLLNAEIKDSDRRATVLSLESISRRLCIGIVGPIAGFYGEYLALYIFGAVGLVGFGLLWLTSAHSPAKRDASLRVPTATVEESSTSTSLEHL